MSWIYQMRNGTKDNRGGNCSPYCFRKTCVWKKKWYSYPERKVLDEIKVRNYKLKKDDYVNSINYIKKELSKAYLLENKVKLGRLFWGIKSVWKR